MSSRLLIHGASGRMGQALLRLAGEFSQLELAAAIAGRQAPQIEGVPGFNAAQLGELPPFDVCVDFSLPDAFDSILACCVERGAAFVSGTTGLDAAQMARLNAVAEHIPVLWAPNFSLGVAVLADLVRRAAQMLPDWQRDIVESHHIHKLDAPSGTALALGRAALEGGGPEPNYASLRAGDIVGEHLVQFTGTGERIELNHRATNRDIFARGALHCAAVLARRDAGRYAVIELLC
ncbi:4-hydroxy-tetrahydrodipicolinate reductase [Denitratimonas sp. CY0512]|uniref:4-hydroxy-tetrahydrodipicolinate reductase n=1 Tax=Denitratimonas sp. CY0512 TaxID=3131940 RepID=UPI0030AE9B77